MRKLRTQNPRGKAVNRDLTNTCEQDPLKKVHTQQSGEDPVREATNIWGSVLLDQQETLLPFLEN